MGGVSLACFAGICGQGIVMPISDPGALPTSVDLAHSLMAARVGVGDWVMDATAGNGHDTLFLARLVGPSGRVFAFDVQAAAIESTRARLVAEGCAAVCTLVHAGHESLAVHIPVEGRGRLAAVMFNLGWLPGHDKACITQSETTLLALATALDWLRPGGLLTVVVYPGHAGGDAESRQVAAWAEVLPSHTHEVRHYRPANRAGKSPECWAVRIRPV